jgi:hypothetical protein
VWSSICARLRGIINGVDSQEFLGMKNVVIPVVLVGVAAAGAASIKYTGDQAHESMVVFVD